jgi:hypothetical protein
VLRAPDLRCARAGLVLCGSRRTPPSLWEEGVPLANGRMQCCLSKSLLGSIYARAMRLPLKAIV